MYQEIPLTPLDKEIPMSEPERRRDYMDPTIGAWHGWGSPVGLGMFFVLVAVAFDVVRLALK
jgi:hypothetical protein